MVRVSRRAACGHYASVRADARSSVGAGRIAPRAITLPKGSHIPAALVRPSQPTLARPPESRRGQVPARAPAVESGSKRFPFNNFTRCLTLFSKCFSSFDHSTCALSVSSRYLALEEIYLPFRAAFPNNSTRRRGLTWLAVRSSYGVLTLFDAPFQGTCCARGRRDTLSKLQLGLPQGGPDFKFGLLPLHSPLLGQFLLVSFPPLIDMLKFSGYPYPIRGQPLINV